MRPIFLYLIALSFWTSHCKSWGKFWQVTLCDENVGYAAMSGANYASRFTDMLTIERDKGSYGSLSVDLGQMPVAGTADKWIAGVLAPNGKIYGIPYSSTSVLTIDPETNFANTAAITGLTGLTKWKGGVLAPNGKIYAVPESETVVLIIDPETNAANTTTITGIGSSYNGVVLGPNGKAYAIPNLNTNILVINTNTNTTSTIAVGSAVSKWSSGVLATNGKIYTSPLGVNYSAIIDTATDTVDLTTLSGLPAGSFGAGALAPNGKIYFTPVSATYVLIIDPATNTYNATAITAANTPGLYDGTNKWAGAVLAPNGKIYGIPLSATAGVLIIDPQTDTASVSPLPGISSDYTSGILAANGKIYAIPRGAGNVAIMDPKANGSLCSAAAQSAYLNKM